MEEIIRGAKIFSLVSFWSGGIGVLLIAIGVSIFPVPGIVFGLICLLAVACVWISWNSHKISSNILKTDPEILASQDKFNLRRHLLRDTYGVIWII